MVRSLLTTGSLTLCWLFSPDSLVLAGNSTGKGGWYFLFPYLLALAVSCWAVTVIYRITRHSTIGIQSTIHFPEKFRPISSLVFLSLTLGCCLSLALFIPTGTLVTAGFTFNETFLYWFPNFGFSFLLLAAILLSHLWSEKLPVILQICFFSTTVCCLSILTVAGLHSGQEFFFSIAEGAAKGTDPLQTVVSFWGLFCTALLLFLGYDQGKSFLLSWRYRVLLVVAGGLIVGLWCSASLLHVPQSKLAISTTPYILGAREILGQQGRILIGITIICGTFSVVNGLLLMTNRLLQQQLVSTLPQTSALSALLKQRLFATFISILIGCFLVLGLAGEERLETYIFGSLLLWILLTAVRIYAGLYLFRKTGGKTAKAHFYLPVLFLLCFISLLLTHNNPGVLVAYLAVVLISAAAIAAVFLFYSRKFITQPNINKGDNS